MRIFRAVSRIGVVGLVIYGAVTGMFRPTTTRVETVEPPRGRSRLVLKTIAFTLLASALIAIVGALLFMRSGVYPIAADRPHFAPVRWFLQKGRTYSIQFHSTGIRAPNLGNRSLFKPGLILYRKNCQPCHGAPGVAGDALGIGINPKPPQLATVGTHWNDAQLYWIVSRGLKMSGMPAFDVRLSDADRWAIIAFLRRLSRMMPTEYKNACSALDNGVEPVSWGIDDDAGFAQIRSGNPRAGRQRVRDYGCITCHTIPRVGSGLVGPPLAEFAERQYIAGFLLNVPANAIKWIMNPKQYKPGTAMPVLGVKSQEAVDIAAYLYSLGDQQRIRVLQESSTHSQ